jgi:hypothetical protein
METNRLHIPTDEEFKLLSHLNASSVSRRHFLTQNGLGLGALSLGALFGVNAFDARAAGAPLNPLAPKDPHFPAKAKAVIHLFASGAPSHVDTWDPKPALKKYDGQTIPGGGAGVAFGSPFEFTKSGKSGVEVNLEAFPKLGEVIDDIAVIRSLFIDIPDHGIASSLFHTGSAQLPKPSMGSWLVYGLGTENQNMPGFITLGGNPTGRQCSFLPGIFQGVNVDVDPSFAFAPKAGVMRKPLLANIQSGVSSTERQKSQLEFSNILNKMHSATLQSNEMLEARIKSFEVAFKMQTEATDAFDISKEPDSVKELYGIDTKTNRAPNEAVKLLVARRLVQRGVRFVQVDVGGWDHHNDIETNIKARGNAIDTPAAALINDLRSQGLLDSTLVIWGGEFARTVTRANGSGARPGRDHHGRSMVAWMAGGGVKGGQAYGASDEFGLRAVENRMSVHDFHATILHLTGFDHTKFTYRYNGRDFRLTDNFGEVAKPIVG